MKVPSEGKNYFELFVGKLAKKLNHRGVSLLFIRSHGIINNTSLSLQKNEAIHRVDKIE